jgi:tRNA uridine 5-carboxymethylaminomethyl modification enzyme
MLSKSADVVALSDLESALADSLYSGYLQAQETTNRRLNQHDSLNIPDGFAFTGVRSLSHEMVERLQRAQPRTFGQARKLPGLTPAALSNLLIHLTAAQQPAA